MLGYLLRRIGLAGLMLFGLVCLTFVISNVAPSDPAALAAGPDGGRSQIEQARRDYGLDKPPLQQYLHWVWGMLHGDFGYSFEFNLPVSKVVGDRMLLTIIVSGVTILFTWAVAFPIGIYSATHQYSWGDYGLSLIGFLGIAIPN